METVISSLIILFLTLLIGTVFCNPLISDPNTEVTYAEIDALGVSCYPYDSCNRNEKNAVLTSYNCDCDKSCAIYDTCCVDSKFKIHKESPENNNLKCLGLYNSPKLDVFMVDSCKSGETFDNLCFSDPEETNDPFLIVPVTSNTTGITYKNYFCAVCNEDVDSTELEFWDMQIKGNGELFKNLSEPKLTFNKEMRTWTALNGTNNGTSIAVPVTLSIEKNEQPSVKYCSSDLISNCSSNWTDDSVEIKCRDYMAIANLFNARYRNPHCALCNFENLNTFECFSFKYNLAPVSGGGFRPSVSLDIPLINIFVVEDRKKRCGKNMVYDKFADKCRCNSRIYAQENGKCVHKI